VTPYADCSIEHIWKHMDSYLSQVEQEGISRFHDGQRGIGESARRMVENLKIAEAERVSCGAPPRIWIVGAIRSASGSQLSAERLNQAIECEAIKDDNRRKLAASQCRERPVAASPRRATM